MSYNTLFAQTALAAFYVAQVVHPHYWIFWLFDIWTTVTNFGHLIRHQIINYPKHVKPK